jgi:putative hemolysin
MLIKAKLLQAATVSAIVLATWGCTRSDMTTAERVALANPASVNCIKVGGKLAIQHTSHGEVGMCRLPSGNVCEEWALFRGECS